MCFHRIVKLFSIFVNKVIISKCPKIYLVLADQVNQWPFSRTLIGFFVGVVSAFLIWETFVRNLDLQSEINFYILNILIIGIGPGYALSKRVRCTTCLIIVGLLGKSGRNYAKAVFFALVISGPITNLALNAKEVLRVFACAKVLTFNLTKTRFDLMSKPFINAVLLMKSEGENIKDTLNDFHSIIEPVRSEIEDEFDELDYLNRTRRDNLVDENDTAKKNYMEKIRRLCQLQFQKGTQKCLQAFNRTYTECMDILPPALNYLLCWIMKVDSMCTKLDEEELCDPEGVINENFTKYYNSLKAVKEQFLENVTDVHLETKTINPKKLPGVISAKKTGKVMIETFNEKVNFFNFWMKIMNKLLAFIFIKLIYNSNKYNAQYLKNIDFDNFYVTNYFKRIDERRRLQNRHYLLPLKKFERTYVFDSEDHTTISRAEKSNLCVHLLHFFLQVTTVLFFLLLDLIFYLMLELVRKHSEIDFHHSGSHNLSFSINGTGLVAKLLKSSLLGLNINEKSSTFISNKPCLPNPVEMSKMFYVEIFGLIALIITLILYQVPLMRTRRLICSYYYPKREKKRVLHLYNTMMKNRRLTMENIINEFHDRSKTNKIKQDMNIFIYLRLNYPKQMGWLIKFKFARRKCVICGELETVFRKNSSSKKNSLNNKENVLDNIFVICPEENCNTIYCKDCWRDIGEICLVCQS